MRRRRYSGSWILDLGKINLKNGRSKYFNIYETWGEDSTYEIYETKNRKGETEYRIVVTSGTKPLAEVGEDRDFVSYRQPSRHLFNGKLVDFAVGTDLKEKVEKYGNHLKGYTYK